MEIENQYPIGAFEEDVFSVKVTEQALAGIKFLPQAVEAAIVNLDEAQLHTPYRDGGWTVHQVVHHIADSHLHAYIRCKHALTEENPSIKPYREAAWAELRDVKVLPVNISITLLYALHGRWYEALKDITEAQWQRTVYHPEQKRELSIAYLLQWYAWHGRHHVAQINYLRDKMRW